MQPISQAYPVAPTLAARPPPPPEVIEAAPLEKVKLIRNDHNHLYIATGEPPQNFVREAESACRFAQYPRWGKLIQAKEQVHQVRVHPAQKLRCDLKTFDLTSINTNFDVILVDPPWEEYSRRSCASNIALGDQRIWTLDELKRLKIDQIAENPSFLFIWAGDEHLDDARSLMLHWGFRRCEDITWLKTLPSPRRATTNTTIPHLGSQSYSPVPRDPLEDKLDRSLEWMRDQHKPLGLDSENAILKRVKEHCLMGLKGLVRRSLDGHFVHANIDTDVIIGDIPPGQDPDGLDSTAKPIEMYEIIERFCLGRRKLELFGTERNARPGWLTLGLDIEQSMFNHRQYVSWFENKQEDNGTCWEGGTSASDATRAASFLGYQGAGPMSVQQSGLFKAGLGHAGDQSLAREENPLANKNAYPNITDYRGGRYEGSSQTLEFLRPKSPPMKPSIQSTNSPGR